MVESGPAGVGVEGPGKIGRLRAKDLAGGCALAEGLSMGDDVRAASLVWTNAAAGEKQPTLVRLTPAALTLATIPAADLDRAVTALNDGEELAGQVVPLSAVVAAEGDDGEAGLTVRFRAGSSKVEEVTVPFADAAAREEMLVALAGALGPGWERRRRPVSRWKAALWVLLPTAVVALVTWGMHAEATMIAEGKPPFNWGRGGKLGLLAVAAHWVEEQLGPTGVLIAGGALVGVGLLLLVLILLDPPMRVVVGPAGGGEAAG